MVKYGEETNMKKVTILIFSGLLLLVTSAPVITSAATTNITASAIVKPITVSSVNSSSSILLAQAKLTMWTMPGRSPYYVTVSCTLPVKKIKTVKRGNYTCYWYQDAAGRQWYGDNYLP